MIIMHIYDYYALLGLFKSHWVLPRLSAYMRPCQPSVLSECILVPVHLCAHLPLVIPLPVVMPRFHNWISPHAPRVAPWAGAPSAFCIRGVRRLCGCLCVVWMREHVCVFCVNAWACSCLLCERVNVFVCVVWIRERVCVLCEWVNVFVFVV